MADDTHFLSIPEAAARLGVSRIAVFKKVKKGRIAAIRIGRNWAIPAAALETPAAEVPRPARPAPTTPPPASPLKPAPHAAAAKIPAAKKETLEDMGWD